jgi:DNA-binding MarR family transcriptional regulator
MPSKQRTDAATRALTQALEEFFRATKRARGREASRPAGDGVTLAQFQLLEPLADGPRTNRQLADAAGVASPTATRMIDLMTGRGLVSRVEDPGDRRAVLISLTPAGREALQAKLDEYEARRERVAEAIEPGERAVAARLLQRLAAAIEDM